MQHYEKYEETVERYRLLKTTCDKCGKEIPDEASQFDVREFELKFGKGSSFPTGGNLSGWQVRDLCDNCAEWLKSLLVENGVQVSVLESDW